MDRVMRVGEDADIGGEETDDADRNGGAEVLAHHAGSISVPARKVSMIAPNPARKFTHSVSGRPIALPASAPTMISISATETATRIETIAATSARPIHKADCSQTCPIDASPPLTRQSASGRQNG